MLLTPLVLIIAAEVCHINETGNLISHHGFEEVIFYWSLA